MSAFPMYARCALSQWRGLTWYERLEIDVAWESKNTSALGNVGHQAQAHYPLWTVRTPLHPDRYLMSVKVD